MQLESMYQEIILDHYRRPKGRGLREPYDVEVHHVNPTCGDEITLRVRLSGDEIEDVSYEGIGCSISQASASVLYELVDGKDITQALATGDDFRTLMQSKGDPTVAEKLEDALEDAVAFAGVSKYPSRIKCALMSWMALKDATAQALAAQEESSSPAAHKQSSSTAAHKQSSSPTAHKQSSSPTTGKEHT